METKKTSLVSKKSVKDAVVLCCVALCFTVIGRATVPTSLIGLEQRMYESVKEVDVALFNIANKTSVPSTQTLLEGDSSLEHTTAKQKDTGFQQIVDRAYKAAVATPPALEHRKFMIQTWKRRTTGGLSNSDRSFLAKTYGAAESVFEYGLGESTFIADHVGVARYVGVDSDPAWVARTRSNVTSGWFRFHFADVGETKEWGYPKDPELPKIILNYQLAPLIAEQLPFDVYLADGRWRVPCLVVSFLHASARGANHNHTTVILHDCERDYLHTADPVLDFRRVSLGKLCVYKRKPNTTDQQLVDMWGKVFADMF